MKIFSNFDTQSRAKALAEHQAQYGAENILCFGRSKLYWLVRVFFPFILWTSLIFGIGALVYFLLEYSYFWWILGSAIVFSILFLGPVVVRYIDYKMDFIIVTPDSLTLYEQIGFWSKKIITVNEKSIKTISVEKAGFWYSVFNNGDLIFLAEGDVTSHGDITLRWVPKPEKRRKEIAVLMNKDI